MSKRLSQTHFRHINKSSTEESASHRHYFGFPNYVLTHLLTYNTLTIRFRFYEAETTKTCEVAVHFNKIPHTLGDFSFQCIDQVQAHNNSEEIERLLITKEAYWSAQLFSLAPHGLNKRKEFHSKNRICYN